MSDSFHIDDFLFSSEYALTKANLDYFQPSLLLHSEKLFLKIKNQQKKFKEDFRIENLQLPYRKKGSERFLELVKTGPVIFISFHIGPVAPLLSYLSNHEINFKLLQDQFYFDKGAGSYPSIYSEYIRLNGLHHHFDTLNVEEKHSGIKIAKTLRDQSSLLLFIDGNTGIGGINRQDSKLCIVDFLGRKIFARKGISYFSHLFNAPIIPVACYLEKSNEEENYILEFSEPIFPDQAFSREQFAENSTQQLYSLLEKYVMKYPDQWEGWLYVHNFIDKNQLHEEEIQVGMNDVSLPLRFNAKRFSFFIQDGNYFLLNTANYQYHPITEDVYRFLAVLQTPQIIGKNISPDSIFKLLKNGILTKS